MDDHLSKHRPHPTHTEELIKFLLRDGYIREAQEISYEQYLLERCNPLDDAPDQPETQDVAV